MSTCKRQGGPTSPPQDVRGGQDRRLVSYLIGVLVVGLLSSSLATAAGVADPLDRPATLTRSPAKSSLMGITTAGDRVIAVGERGIIVLSDDMGKTWRQAKVPTSVDLTAVEFTTPQQGWAVGHAGVVLHTEDGGENWSRQLDGKIAAQLALEAAQAKAAARPNDKAAQKLLSDAELLVQDGPDKPFLDIHFENAQKGFIVGAYGLIFRTTDGGKTWTSWIDHVDNPKDLNLYSIRVIGKKVYLAGEQGLFLRSADGGNTFMKITTPYEGTYFSVAVFPSGEIVLAGLRGNAYRSVDEGKTFIKVDVPVRISFSVAVMLADGTALFGNQEGALLASSDAGRTIKLLQKTSLRSLTDMVALKDGEVLAVGPDGVIRISLSSAAPITKAETGSVR